MHGAGSEPVRTSYAGLLQLKKVEQRGLRAWKRKRKSVLQSARANGDWMRRPPGHLISGTGRQEMMRKGGGGEIVAASNQFRRSRREKSSRLGLVALTVGPVHMRMRASKERAREGSVCGRAIAAECNQFRRSRGEKSSRLGLVALTVGPVRICG